MLNFFTIFSTIGTSSTYPLKIASISDHKPVGQSARSTSIVNSGSGIYPGQISMAALEMNGDVNILMPPTQDAFCFFDFNYISG